MDDFIEDTERKVENWQENPRQEMAKVWDSTAGNLARFSMRKRAELSTDVRNVTDAYEQGDTTGVVAHGTLYALHLTGLTDVRVTRNIIKGKVSRIHHSVEHFVYHRELGSLAWSPAGCIL